MKNYKVFHNIEFKADKLDSFDSLFEEFEDTGDSVYYKTKKTYYHNDPDGGSFDYNYAVGVIDDLPDEDSGNKRKILVTLKLIPVVECLNDIALNELQDYANCSKDSLRTADLLDNGYYINVSNSDMAVFDDWRKSDIQETLDAIATGLPIIDNLRGYFSDKSNQWDDLNSWLK